MSNDVSGFIRQLFNKKNIDVPKNREGLFGAFAAGEAQQKAFEEIGRIQSRIMKNWQHTMQIDDIKTKLMQIPNGCVGKPYTFVFDPAVIGLEGISAFELYGFEEAGLQWDEETSTLYGIPAAPGDYRLRFLFRTEGSDADDPLEEKGITLIVNADPKSLWKVLPSDATDSYYKPESASQTLLLAGRTAVVASVRGRSHAHEGTFRDDDFKVSALGETGWGLIAVADGAGSARFARRGSALACGAVADYFSGEAGVATLIEMDVAIVAAQADGSDDGKKALSRLGMSHLGKAAYAAHTRISEEAVQQAVFMKEYATTLLFALVKKFEFGYAVLSFWVGDGGIGIYDRDAGTVAVLGVPDGGEFAGQTRFITMPDIFKTQDFYKRMSIRTVPDFTALILMTDGVTDPKFGTDAALQRPEAWHELWNDLAGANGDGTGVALDAANEQVYQELLNWLDFWSPGNHDDRTIAILF